MGKIAMQSISFLHNPYHGRVKRRVFLLKDMQEIAIYERKGQANTLFSARDGRNEPK